MEELFLRRWRMRKLEGDDLTCFSYGHCPRCRENHSIVFFDSNSEAVCKECGAEYILVLKDGLLVSAYLVEDIEEVR